MARNRNPLGYTGKVLASTQRAGLTQLDSTDFSVTDGKASLSGTGALENLLADGGTVTPSSGQLTIAGGTGITTAGATATITANLDETYLRYAEVAVTDAQIKALAATPKTLVAAPGAGKCLEFVSAILKLNAGTSVFTESADNMAIRYTDGSGVVVSVAIEATGFIDQAADTYTNAIPIKDAIVAASGCENKALVLDNTGDGEYAGSAEADASMTVGITYRIHTL